MSLRFTFTILIEERPNRPFIAHCLEMDLMVDSPTVEEAMKDIVDIMCVHIDFAHRHGVPFINPAPKKFWDKLRYAIPLVSEPTALDSCPINTAEYPFVYDANFLKEMSGATHHV